MPPLVLDSGTRVNVGRRAAPKAREQGSTSPSDHAPDPAAPTESAEQAGPRRRRIILTPRKPEQSPAKTGNAAGTHEEGENPPKGAESRAQPQDRPWALKPMFIRPRQAANSKTEPAMRRDAVNADGEGGPPARSGNSSRRAWPRRGAAADAEHPDRLDEERTPSTRSHAGERRGPSEPPLTLGSPLSSDDDDPPLRAHAVGQQAGSAAGREAPGGIAPEPAAQSPETHEIDTDGDAPLRSGSIPEETPETSRDAQADAAVAAQDQFRAPGPAAAQIESASNTAAAGDASSPADAPEALPAANILADTPAGSISADSLEDTVPTAAAPLPDPEDAADHTPPPEVADDPALADAEGPDKTGAAEDADAADLADAPEPAPVGEPPRDAGELQAAAESSGDGIFGQEAAGPSSAAGAKQPADNAALESADTPMTVEPAEDDGAAGTAPLTAAEPTPDEASAPETTETASIGPVEEGEARQPDIAAAPEAAPDDTPGDDPDDAESAMADGAGMYSTEAGLANTAEAEEPTPLAAAPVETPEDPDPSSEETDDTGAVVSAVQRESTGGGAEPDAEAPESSASEAEAPGPAAEPEQDDSAMEARVLAEVAKELERRAHEAAEAMEYAAPPEPDAEAQPVDAAEPGPEDAPPLPSDKAQLRNMIHEIVRQELSSAMAEEIDRRVHSVVAERLLQAFAPRSGG